MKPQSLSIDLLRIDADTQNRSSINEDVVQDYADLIAESNGEWPFPPLDVFHDGTEHYVADGVHRILGGRRTKRGSVPCHIHKGTAHDARIFGMTANDKHGLRMTRADKRACVEWLLDNGGKMTQTEIATKAGVGRRLVQTIVADRKPKFTPKQPPLMATKAQKALLQPEEGGDPFDETGDPFGEDGRTDSDGMDTQESIHRPPRNGKDKPVDRSYWYKQWNQSIGPIVRLVDKIAENVGDSKTMSRSVVQDHLNIATEEMMEWMQVRP